MEWKRRFRVDTSTCTLGFLPAFRHEGNIIFEQTKRSTGAIIYSISDYLHPRNGIYFFFLTRYNKCHI